MIDDAESNKPTQTEYTTLQQSFDWLNLQLWDSKLPQALITMQRKSKAYGYFSPGTFKAREGDSAIDEIALNPDGFMNRTDREILSTLCHEMAHLWQQSFGEPPTKCYHDKEWANEMERIGLMPSDTGGEGGKKTGRRVSHYIIEGGPFDAAITVLLEARALGWQSMSTAKERAKKRTPSKVKYSCPGCGQNAWAKPGASIVCGECEEPMGGEE